MKVSIDNKVSIIMRTLITGGFIVRRVDRHASHLQIESVRYDEFGIPVRYLISIGDPKFNDATEKALKKVAITGSQNLLLVECVAPVRAGALVLDDFLRKLGGPVNTWLPLATDFTRIMDELGHMKLPKGTIGRPDDLFEESVKQALQFAFGSRVIRYGQERRFENVPDGVGFPKHNLTVMYDAKAYTKGYPFSKESIRAFSEYVNDFNKRYAHYVNPVYAFIVVSGHFEDSKSALESRAGQLYAECSTKLVCVQASELASACKAIERKPTYRGSLNWRSILSSTTLRSAKIQKELSRISKDKVLR